MDDTPKGQPLAIDATAQSASPTEPAFIARPEGAPVYYGFVVLDDVAVDGFTLGKITGHPLPVRRRRMRSARSTQCQDQRCKQYRFDSVRVFGQRLCVTDVTFSLEPQIRSWSQLK